MLRKVSGVIDHDHAPPSLERPQREVLLHLADLLDRDLLAVVLLFEVDEAADHADVRVRLVVDLAACETCPAAAGRMWLTRAEQRLRETDRHCSLADRPRAAELVRVGDVTPECTLAQPGEEATLPDEVSHRVLARF